MEPLVLFEDNDLLVVNKPAGINHHAPGEFAVEGLHEWLQRRRREKFATIHRLDKDTSGVVVFGKSALANRSLTEQFAGKTARKTYHFLSAAPPPAKRLRVTTPVDGKPAATWFETAGRRGRFALVRAEPETGRTHQIRIHAAEAGFPVAGDDLHERPLAVLPRMMLHAAAIELRHPRSGQLVRFQAPEPQTFATPDWLVAAREMRALLFDPAETSAFRLVSGRADGFEGAAVDCYADRLLVQWYARPLPALRQALPAERVVERQMARRPAGAVAPEDTRFVIIENGIKLLASLDAGYSTGVFLDQRENRRRLLAMDFQGKTALNCFAYTCAFSVAAARAGAAVTSLDLSKKHLDWGRDNFRLNGLDPGAHDFIYGDCFDWLKRLARKGRRFDLVLLDPPTFSTAGKGGVFRADKDYARLVALVEPLVKQGGRLFCSTNARAVTPPQLLDAVRRGAPRARSVEFATQPPDFRVATGEQPYLKTLWAALE